MPRFSHFAAPVLAMACASPAATAADVTLVFVQPETFQDAAYSRPFASEKDIEVVRSDMERHLRSLASRLQAPDDALLVEVLDLDLAGWFNPFWPRSGGHVRVVRDIGWPRIKLRYTLTRGNQVIASGEDQLADMNYLMTVNRYPMSDRLRYEKPMLDDWFARRIAGRRGQELQE